MTVVQVKRGNGRAVLFARVKVNRRFCFPSFAQIVKAWERGIEPYRRLR